LLEYVIAFLYVMGAVMTSITIYANAENIRIRPERAALAIALWPVVPFALGVVLALEELRERF
jgi:hypothetical protein